jgi:hypothetical protein
MIQDHYGYIGYPLYISLFVACFYGLLPGVVQPLKRSPTLRREILRVERRWLLWAVGAMLALLALASWPMVFGPFQLLS